MKLDMGALFGAALLAFSLRTCVLAQSIDWTSPLASYYSNDGTYYGAGSNDAAACSYGTKFFNTLGLPWTTGVQEFFALNDPMFDGSYGCGTCLMFRGINGDCTTCGTVPFPSEWTMGFIDNQCPECEFGSLDMAASGDGRWEIEWYPVPCATGDSPFSYGVDAGGSETFLRFTISNTRVPIASVQATVGGASMLLPRSGDNHWIASGALSFPFEMKITSVLGDTVTDGITGLTGNTGTVQFPDRGNIGVFSMAGGGAAPATPAETPAATPEATPAPVPTETPVTPVETPAAPVETPAPPVETPAAPVETPAPPVETPAAPVETPAAPVETPAAPVETPAAPVETPAAPLETPAAPVETPAGPVETPAAPVATPAAPVETPAAPVETPAVPTETPAAPVETPAAPVATETPAPSRQPDEGVEPFISYSNNATYNWIDDSTISRIASGGRKMLRWLWN